MKCKAALALVCLFASPAIAGNFLILPFFNLSKDASLEWIGESLSEAVREALAGEGMIVVSREDREEAFRRLSLRPQTLLTKATVIRVGEFLDAHQIIYGTFDFTPSPDGGPKGRGTLKIAAQIIDLSKATRLPEYTEIGALEDLARLQTHLAWQTLRYVLPDSTPTEEAFRARRTVIRVEAIENYVRGLLTTNAEQKLKYLSQAARIEPRFAQANFELGRLYLERNSYRLAVDHLGKVGPNDLRFREATFLLGLARFRLGDFAGAEQAFRRVAEAVPLNEVWNNLGAAQSRLGSPEALESFQKALEGDPADPDYHFNVGYALFRRGNLEAAAERFRAVLDRDPEDAEAIMMLGRCLKKTAQPARNLAQRTEGLERLKEEFEESAYLQLKAVLEPKK